MWRCIPYGKRTSHAMLRVPSLQYDRQNVFYVYEHGVTNNVISLALYKCEVICGVLPPLWRAYASRIASRALVTGRLTENKERRYRQPIPHARERERNI
jgi:hypothetical protein